MRVHLLIMSLALTGPACSNANLKKAPFLTGSTFVEEKVASSDAAAAQEGVLEPVPMPAESKAREEKVSPPSNISGSYLICSEMKAATEASPESVINCGLRDQKTNNKVNILGSFSSQIWSYQAASASNLVVSMLELPLSLEWHISVTLKSTTLAELQAQQGSLRFFVSVMNSAGIKFQESTPITSTFVRWLALDGGTIPTAAAIGGTEDGGRDTLFLCRMYVGAEVIPGKLSIHHSDSSKSNCYSSQNGLRLQSQSDDGDTMIHRTDVLVVTQGVFDNYFEWVPATNGLKPAQAIITGRDALGNPLYTCRNLQVDNNVAEQTPGVLRPGASSCVHEFYGVETNINYQVLVWKASGTQQILDARLTPSP